MTTTTHPRHHPTGRTGNGSPSGPVVVVGATGKTGRRVAARLDAMGVPVRRASRTATTTFDWTDPDGWPAAFAGAGAAYLTYVPDLAAPGSQAAIAAVSDVARRAGVDRLVLLSGRGEDDAQRCERIVQDSGLAWTIVRSSWFNQNFSEGAMLESVRTGAVALPVDLVTEPFIDADDIADVAVAALTEDGHDGQVYEVTGPRLLTFADVVEEIGRATGREILFTPVALADYRDELLGFGVPLEEVDLLSYLFGTVLDGRNSSLGDGVDRALGRPARDFGEFAARAAAAGAWS
jgi:uncharacterized protein YbjT (DUF2867 family)